MFGKKSKYPTSLLISPETEAEAQTAQDTGTVQGQAQQENTAAPEKANSTETPAAMQKSHTDMKTGGVPVKESDLTASVSRNTIFTGNIESKDNIEIFGNVEGSISSIAIVRIYGKVHGDITCGMLIANNATIIGNIICEKSVGLGNDTNVNGNINAAVVNISGQVNGNVAATESVSVSDSGAVYGDITTPVIEVCKGAIVFGSVVMEHQEPPAPAKKAKETANEAAVKAPIGSKDSQVQDSKPLDEKKQAAADEAGTAVKSADSSKDTSIPQSVGAVHATATKS